jgi:hypothetical protein
MAVICYKAGRHPVHFNVLVLVSNTSSTGTGLQKLAVSSAQNSSVPHLITGVLCHGLTYDGVVQLDTHISNRLIKDFPKGSAAGSIRMFECSSCYSNWTNVTDVGMCNNTSAAA